MRRASQFKIRIDHDDEFKNEHFENFRDENDMHVVLGSKNSIIKGNCRKENHSLQKMSPKCIYLPTFGSKQVPRLSIQQIPRPLEKKNNSMNVEMVKPFLSYFHVFGCKSFILNNKEICKNSIRQLMKRTSRILYYQQSIHVYNKLILMVEEFTYAVSDEPNAMLQN